MVNTCADRLFFHRSTVSVPYADGDECTRHRYELHHDECVGVVGEVVEVEDVEEVGEEKGGGGGR